jgi:multimeric flavodoxin WrbA
LIDKLFEGVAKAGAECNVVTLANLKINRCLACGYCQTEEHRFQCVYDGKDDVKMVFQKMRESDLLIYATPIYIFTMSGLLKTFIDRIYATGNVSDIRLSDSGLMFHHINRSLCSKPFVGLICCDNLETETPKNAVSYFKTFSKFMDAPLAGLLVRNAGGLAKMAEKPGSNIILPKLKEVYGAYKQAGQELAKEGRIRRLTQKKANQEIAPVPLFGLLKRMPFKSLKRKFVERARIM